MKKIDLSHNDSQLTYILEALPQNKNIFILDAGCGDGRYSAYLLNMGYKNIAAVDLFEKSMVEGIEYITSSIDNLPFDNNSFDFIFSNSVIFYVEPPIKALFEFHRVLTPGGSLIFTAHTKWSFFTLKRLIKRDLLRLKQMNHLVGVKFYTASYYHEALEKVGFIVHLRDGWRFSFILYPAYTIFRAVVKKFIGVILPLKRPYITKNKFLSKIKSELSYHSVFIAFKRKL